MKYSAFTTAVVVSLATPGFAFLPSLSGGSEGKPPACAPRKPVTLRSTIDEGHLDNIANENESALPVDEAHPPPNPAASTNDEPAFATYVDQMGRSFPPIKKALLSPGPNKKAKMNPATGGPGVGVVGDYQGTIPGTMVAPPPPEEPEIVYSKPAQTFQTYMEQIGGGATVRSKKGRYAPASGKKHAATGGTGLGNFAPGSQQAMPEIYGTKPAVALSEPSASIAHAVPDSPSVAEIAAKAFAHYLDMGSGNGSPVKKASYTGTGMGSYLSNVASVAPTSYSIPEPTNSVPIFDYSLEQTSGGSSAYFSSRPSRINAPTRNLGEERGMGGYLENL